MHYFRGKADWIVRGLPSEPAPPFSERVRALRYFVNNLAPGFRDAWTRYSNRTTVRESMRDDLAHLNPDDPVPAAPTGSPTPRAVVLNPAGVLLGAIDRSDLAPRARDIMNSAPQTIRSDMTPRLAAKLLESTRYLIVTTEHGKYLGRYLSMTPSPEMSR
jgi:CBS domain protein